MKEQILNLLNMKDILYKYNVKFNHNQFCCPFHNDKTPSAKAYEKTFYCFGCNKTGDIIQFVEYLYNLSFKEAMQKINEDFGLGLDSNVKIDYSKINKIRQEKEFKKREKQKIENEFKNLCITKEKYKKEIRNIKEQINLSNWESKVYDISKIKDLIGIIDMKLDNLLNKICSFKNSNY